MSNLDHADRAGRRRRAAVVITVIGASAALVASASLLATVPASAAPGVRHRVISGWSAQGTVPDTDTGQPPAAASFHSRIYVAWTDRSTGDITYSVYIGKWSAPKTVTGSWGTAVSNAGPALTVYNGDLYAAWTSKARQIRYSDLTGSTWSKPKTVTGTWGTASTSVQPTLGAYGSDMYVGWITPPIKTEGGEGNVFYGTYNGTKWLYRSIIHASPIFVAPGLAGDPVKGHVAVSYLTPAFNARVTWCLVNGCPAAEPTFTIAGSHTATGPALAFLGGAHGTLYIAWRNDGNSQIDYVKSVNGKKFSVPTRIPKALTGQTPALAANGSTLYAVWRGEGSNDHLWFSSAAKA